MGLIRKTMSVGSLGAVDYRSDKERTARYSRQTRDAVRQANGRDAQADWNEQLAGWNAGAAAPQQGITPGWYVDEQDPRFVRWWDATGPSWHVHTMPPPDAPPLPPPGATGAPQAAPSQTLGDELARLADLHRSGVLTDAEFAAAKARLLSQ